MKRRLLHWVKWTLLVGWLTASCAICAFWAFDRQSPRTYSHHSSDQRRTLVAESYSGQLMLFYFELPGAPTAYEGPVVLFQVRLRLPRHPRPRPRPRVRHARPRPARRRGGCRDVGPTLFFASPFAPSCLRG